MTPIIDCHAHIVPPDMWRAMLADGARYGVEIGGSEQRRMIRLAGSDYARPMYLPLTATDERIATMDRQGVDMQVLSGYIDFSGYTMPLDLGTRFAELQNETIAAVVAADPTRYAGRRQRAAAGHRDGDQGDGAGAARLRLSRRADRALLRRQEIPRRSVARSRSGRPRRRWRS